MALIEGDFAPRGALANTSVQSLLASLRLRRHLVGRRSPAMQRAARRHVLDCGDGVRLECWASLREGSAATGLVVLIHGWEGCHESVYLHSAASYLYDRGWDIVRLNLRDHGGTHHLNEEMFHSARMDEVFGALAAVRRLTGHPAYCLAGFSLGGNFVLRVAAAGKAHDLAPQHVVAVNPAVNPAHTTAALDESPWLYQRYFMRKWRRSQSAKAAAHPQRYDFSQVPKRGGFIPLTRHFAETYTPYESLEAYFSAYTVTPEHLRDSPPVTIVSSHDDPVVPVTDFNGFDKLPQVELLLTRRGGHCGYVSSWSMHSWLEPQIERRFAACVGSPRSD